MEVKGVINDANKYFVVFLDASASSWTFWPISYYGEAEKNYPSLDTQSTFGARYSHCGSLQAYSLPSRNHTSEHPYSFTVWPG